MKDIKKNWHILISLANLSDFHYVSSESVKMPHLEFKCKQCKLINVKKKV